MSAAPNANGVYQPEIIEEVARRGRSYAQIEIAFCQDGLYHFALVVRCSDRGFGGPITDASTGYVTVSLAKDAGVAAMLGRFPRPLTYDHDSIRQELTDMRVQIEKKMMQPTLF